MPTNIELKSRLDSIPAAEDAIRRAGAVMMATLHQVDTYFKVAHGRLKLREFPDRPAELIAYHRADEGSLRPSLYQVTPITLADAAGLRQSLEGTLGVKVVVGKVRRLWVYQTVRIHLDEVEGLGSFVEIESLVLPEVPQEMAVSLAHEVWAMLPVCPEQRITGSYSDLMLDQQLTTPN